MVNDKEFFSLFSVTIDEKPDLGFRYYNNSDNNEEITAKLKSIINDAAIKFDIVYNINGYYIFDNPANIIYRYSDKAKNYFYYCEYYKIDSISDLYLFKLKYLIKDVLLINNIEKIQIQLTLPKYSPLPPPNY